MTGLFYDIRSYFDQRFSGRYISRLLRELARHEASSFCMIVEFAASSCDHDWHRICADLRHGQATVECEWRFAGRRGIRRADLAVLREGQPVLFFEVKEDDAANPANLAQTLDYLSRRLPLIHLSRFPPEGLDGRALGAAARRGRPVASIRYRDVHRLLRSVERPFATMLCDYLEDIAVGTYRPIDLRTEERPLAFMMTQMLGFPHAQGLGRLHAREAVSAFPQLLQRMFDDLEYVAEWIHQANRSNIKTRFTRGLRPHQWFNLSQLVKGVNKALEKGDVRDVDVLPGAPGKYVHEGDVYFYAYGRIRSGPHSTPKLRNQKDWLYVEVGFGFHIRRGSGRGASEARIVKPFLYTSFYGNKIKVGDAYEETPYLAAFPTEKVALRRFRRCLTDSRALAMKATGDARFEAALRNFRIPPLP